MSDRYCRRVRYAVVPGYSRFLARVGASAINDRSTPNSPRLGS